MTFHMHVTANQNKTAYSVVADSTEYDKNSNTITLKGKVEVFKNHYILRANKIVYSKETKKAFAYGDVVLITPTGEEIYAKELEIDNNLKEAISYSLSARLAKDNKFIARHARHYYPDRTDFTNVVYTPCPVCKDKIPQWQIRSKKIYYEKKKDVSYWNNFFELYGMPVFYFPYIRTPAPDAEPRSGFLFPSNQKYRDVYGYGIIIPYYYRISNTQDLTYSPIITTEQGVLHRAEYRKLFKRGYYNFNAHYIRPRKLLGGPNNRFYLRGNSRYSINNNWWLDGEIERVSDKSYLSNYWDRSESYLTSSAGINYVNNRDYSYIKSYHFQGLRTDNRESETPVILPAARYHKDFFDNNNKYSLDIGASNIVREKSNNTRRGSLVIGWHKTYFWQNHQIGVSRNVRADIYDFDDKNSAKVALDQNNQKIAQRLLPEIIVGWKYPLLKKTEKYSVVLEPIVDIILSPNSSSNRNISVNEDSQAIELEDSNLFSTNRYSGSDFVEHGVRSNYGVFTTLMTDNIGEYRFLFGQSYLAHKNNEYPIDSGLRSKNFSDYVGRFSIIPSDFLELYYKIRLDSRDHTLRKGEFGSNIRFDTGNNIITKIELGTRFNQYNLIESEGAEIKKSLSLLGNMYIYKEWYIGGEVTKNFTSNASFNVHTKAHIGYTGDCTSFKISAMKKDTEDARRNIRPTKGISLDWEIHLKNIN